MASIVVGSNFTLMKSFVDRPAVLQGDIAGSMKECMIALNQYNSDVTIVKIANAIGGFLAFCKLPVLPWIGHSRILESREIRPRDLLGSLMRSKDDFNKPFIALKTNAIPEGPQGEKIFRQTFITQEKLWPCHLYFGRNAFCKVIREEIDDDQFQWEVRGGTMKKDSELKLYIKKLA